MRTDNKETVRRLREYETALEAGLKDAESERVVIAESKEKARAAIASEWEKWERPRRRMSEVFARVGTGPARNAKWLLMFYRAKPGDQIDFQLLDEVTAFAFLSLGVPPEVMSAWKSPDHRGSTVFVVEGVPVGLAAVWKQVQRLHGVVCQALDTLIATGRVRLPAVPIGRVIDHGLIFKKWRQTFPQAKDHTEVDPAEYRILPPDHPRSLFTLFVSRLGDVLAASAKNLWTCAVCGRVFFRVRSDAVHCSNACRSRVNMRTYRERLKKRRAKKRTVKGRRKR